MIGSYEQWVGIDLARRGRHKAVLVNRADGAPKGAKSVFNFTHDCQGFAALAEYLRDQAGSEGLADLAVNVEPTSGAWQAVTAFTRWVGASPHYTRTDVVSQQRKVFSKHAKTDRIDARTLAGIAFTLPERVIPAPRSEARVSRLRALSTQRHRLVEDTTRWKNRLVARLEIVWRPLLCELSQAQPYSALACAFWRRFADPRKVQAMGRKAFGQWAAKNAHGNTAANTIETFWRGAVASAELWEVLDAAGIGEDLATLNDLTRQNLRMIAMHEKEIDDVEKRIKEARGHVPECDVLATLPGVGRVVSTTLASVLLPIDRFANAKGCGAYSGFVSRRHSSSDKDVLGLPVTKTGNRRLKRDLALAADTAMRNDPQLAEFAIRLLSRGKHYNKARVAVGRKLQVRAYSLLKRCAAGETGVTYEWRDPEGKPLTRQEAKALAGQLWAAYNATKTKKGSPPNPAKPWQSKDSTKQSPEELPSRDCGHNHARRATLSNEPINCGKPVHNLRTNLKPKRRKKG